MALGSYSTEAVRSISFLVVVAAAIAQSSVQPPAIVTTAGYIIDSENIDIAGWIEVLFGIQLDQDEQRCANQSKVLFRPTNECFRLYHRPPCGPREWLVFDRDMAVNGNLTAVCKPRMCAPNWGYDARTKKCFEQDKCPSNTEFQYTLFGDGECNCANISAPMRGGDATCRELFHPDSCSEGMILAPRYRLLEGVDSTCTANPCFEGTSTRAKPSEPETPSPASDPRTSESGLLVLPKDDSHLGSFLLNRPQPPLPSSNGGDSPSRRASTPGIPTVAPGTPGERFVFPAERKSLVPPSGDPEVEVVLRPEHAQPSSHFRTTTRAVVDSVSYYHGPVPTHMQSWNTHEHSYYAPYPQGHRKWEYIRRQSAPTRRFRRDSKSPAADVGNLREGEGSESHNEVPSTALRALVKSEDNDGTSLLPSSVPNLLLPSFRVSGPASVRRGAANALKYLSKDSKLPASAANPLMTRVGVNAPPSDRRVASAANDSRLPNTSEHVGLNVQYPDGSSECQTPPQLNISCELQMVPLFEMSGVRVPLCYDISFRFAFGRVGKSEDCVENDDGVCAKNVVVKSSEPFDWDLE